MQRPFGAPLFGHVMESRNQQALAERVNDTPGDDDFTNIPVGMADTFIERAGFARLQDRVEVALTAPGIETQLEVVSIFALHRLGGIAKTVKPGTVPVRRRKIVTLVIDRHGHR